ncbi:MAG: hypothetical protein M1817_004972 [Caeruleum heppii]|nr:MAG: hypothetical protein M1817_004972 [Caeruleum heppii]
MAPSTPAMQRSAAADRDIDVGDLVDVPGGMHGTVKFIGNVKGKNGVFAGVELSQQFAQRGKNDGDVEGTRYFTTSIPNSGIFLPVTRASKRASPTVSDDSYPHTPSTPSLGTIPSGSFGGASSATSKTAYTPPTPSVPKFSQSVGPGRAPSPQFKPKSRPSLPRPESPLRRNQNLLTTPAGRPSFGTSTTRNGVAKNPYVASPTPGKFGASAGGRRISSGASYTGDPGKRLGMTPKPAVRGLGSARAGSALGKHDTVEENDGEATPVGLARTSDTSRRSSSNFASKSRPTSGHAEEEIKRLKAKLGERDQQLSEQASSLAEMESSLAELQVLLPTDGSPQEKRSQRGSGSEDAEVPQLRSLLREKNEKIAALNAEFDAHRADFRSTIDTLELASTETERVYEKRVEDLMQEVRDLQDRGEDVESVARQLKQLEELVQELEEGLEDARRGEAEARGEVEFLRGEVERGRSELRREREKAAAALKGAGAAVENGSSGVGSKEVEQRDDEIRGLKAIIHSLSRDSVPDMNSPNSQRSSGPKGGSTPKQAAGNNRASLQLTEERLVRETLEREVKELQGLVERKAFREEELESELQRLRKGANPVHARVSGSTTGSNGPSDRTVRSGSRSSPRLADGKGSTGRRNALETMRENESYDGPQEGNNLWCEICEQPGHDLLTCTDMFGKQQQQQHDLSGRAPASPMSSQRTGRDAVAQGLKQISSNSLRPGDGASPQTLNRKPSTDERDLVVPTPVTPNPQDAGMVAGKASGVIDPNKWCALCERDGHESVDCPFEDAF